jgi:hypothetical protein
VIHVDEKWFYVEKLHKRTYLGVDEEEPIRDVRNKNYIEKVMFLAAVARPQRQFRGVCRNDPDDWAFSGKVGIYPLVKYRNAIINSRLRPAGTVLVENLQITRAV